MWLTHDQPRLPLLVSKGSETNLIFLGTSDSMDNVMADDGAERQGKALALTHHGALGSRPEYVRTPYEHSTALGF